MISLVQKLDRASRSAAAQLVVQLLSRVSQLLSRVVQLPPINVQLPPRFIQMTFSGICVPSA